MPGIQAHLSCLEVKFNFSSRFLSLNKNLQQLRKAVIGVEDNMELKQVCVILLKVGNFLNQGTAKGNSVSFNIELFRNLKTAKAVGDHAKSTMLDFLLSSVLNKAPHVARFAAKLERCEEASKLELSTIQEQLGRLFKQ